MKIKEIWFENDQIYGRDENGQVHSQSLLWYPRLKAASASEREQFTIGLDGLHWRNVDEDISFESFLYDDAQPSAMQAFFLTHKEINIAEFARYAGINATLLRNYINGFKKPSPEREKGPPILPYGKSTIKILYSAKVSKNQFALGVTGRIV